MTQEETGVKHTSDINRKGDFAEYYAVTWLWDNGFEVFQNSGCTGPVDMVALKNGKITLIDVKTMGKTKEYPWYRSKGYLSGEQKTLNVKFLLFNPKTRKLRWARHGKRGRIPNAEKT